MEQSKPRTHGWTPCRCSGVCKRLSLEAAAPEMLEALRGLEKALTEALPPDWARTPYLSGRLHAARAAITKATGGNTDV